LQLLNVGQIAAENILVPADRLYATLLRFGNHLFKYIEASKVGRTKVFESSVGVVLGIDFGIRASEEGVGVLLLATVIG